MGKKLLIISMGFFCISGNSNTENICPCRFVCPVLETPVAEMSFIASEGVNCTKAGQFVDK